MRGNPPLVSVVIPAYNHEKFVEKTIRSVLAQTYPNIELLVLDDGSKDHTFSILQSLRSECEKRFARFWLETQPNQGTCITLNRLLSQAKGEYITILASDDELLPQHCAVLTDFLEKNPQVVLYVGNNEFIDAHDNRLERAKRPRTKFYPLGTNPQHIGTFGEWLQNGRQDVDFLSASFGSYQSLLRNNYLPNGSLLRKNALDKCPPFSTQAPLEDWFLNLQLAKQGEFRYTPQVLFRYRIHATNTVSQHSKMRNFTRLTLLYEITQILQRPDSPWRDTVKQFIFIAQTDWKIQFGKLTLQKQSNFCKMRFFLHLFGKRWPICTLPLYKLPEEWKKYLTN